MSSFRASDTLLATAVALASARGAILAATAALETDAAAAARNAAVLAAIASSTTAALAGVPVASIASGVDTGFGGAAVVFTGPNAGLWVYRDSTLQRYDFVSNQSVGPAYPCPLTDTSAIGHVVGMTVFGGTNLYLCNLGGVDGVATSTAYTFDTLTCTYTEAAAFPRALCGVAGYGARAITLADDRILVTANEAVGLTLDTYEQPFWIVDPVAGTVAEVPTVLPFNFATFTWQVLNPCMTLLPDGTVLISSYSGAATAARSIVLTITGDAIAASPVALVGVELAGDADWCIPTKAGVAVGSAYGCRAFSPGSGWSAATPPLAYGSMPAGHRSQRIPGVGWLLVNNESSPNGTLAINFVFNTSA
jgi:hypothetical protein